MSIINKNPMTTSNKVEAKSCSSDIYQAQCRSCDFVVNFPTAKLRDLVLKLHKKKHHPYHVNDRMVDEIVGEVIFRAHR